METNESILSREIVAIDSRKRIGKVTGIYIDVDTRSVASFMVKSASTESSMILPFEKTLAIGDTFITIEARHDLLLDDNPDSDAFKSGGYTLLNVEVFSRTGNMLGTVEGYEFDKTYGAVTEISLDKRTSFTADQMVFFAPDFVFVDDGDVTAEDYRSGKVSKKKKDTKKPAKRGAKVKPAKKQAVKPASKPSVSTPAQNTSPAKDTNSEDDNLKDFLTGLTVIEDVVSEDGEFKVSSGTVLTSSIVDDAQKHDALVLLTLSVDE